ncbi:MAG: D-alanyl-D-alanine carboxypeptidase/D-alanyl-D-alanine-endopeptidase [Acidimicrobiales bacterium]
MATPFGAARRSRLAAARYWSRVFWFPVLCLVVALIAYRQSSATNSEVADRERVEIVGAQTPVLSARRLPNVLALPSQAVQLQPAVLEALNGVPPDTTCASVTNSRGTMVFGHNPNLLLTPASNQKVLLAHALLNHFPADHRFGTFVATDAQLIANVVQGNVWLIGTGDPVLATQNYVNSFVEQPQVHTKFEEIADQLKTAGITRIRGNVIADATRYDNVKFNPAWPNRYTFDGTVGPVGALVVNRGYATFPPSGQEWSGSGPRTVSADPAKDAATLLINLLRERGIEVEGTAQVGSVPQSPLFLAQQFSPPLQDIIGQMLRNSDNTMAEMLFKELGVVRAGKGSNEGGAAALTAMLAEKGLAAPGMVIVDGSGLAAGNLVPCTTLNGALAAAGRDSTLVQQLAVGGLSGTLKDRLVGSPAQGQVFAKTGSLDTVSSLAGFVDTAKGESISFSVIINAPGGDAERFKALEDRLMVTLMDYPQGADVQQLMPAGL